MKRFSSRYFIIVAAIVVIIIATLSLVGCAPTTVDQLIKANSKTWSEAEHRTVTDEFTVSNTVISLPIKYIIALKVDIKIKNANIKIVREIEGKIVKATFVVENIDLEPIKAISAFVDINYAELKKCKIEGTVNIDDTGMVVNMTATNFENVMADIAPIEPIEISFSRESDAAIINAISSQIGQSLFGNPEDNGKYDSKAKSYNYSIPKATANAELFKIFKLVLDVAGDIPLNGQSIFGLLESVFGSKNLITIIDSIIMPTEDISVQTKVANLGNKYYLGECRAIYVGTGSVSKDVATKILDMIKQTSDDPIVNGIEINGKINISATIAIKTTHKVIK